MSDREHKESKSEVPEVNTEFLQGPLPDDAITQGITTAENSDQVLRDFDRDAKLITIDGTTIADIVASDDKNFPNGLRDVNEAQVKQFFITHLLKKIPDEEKRENVANYLMRHFHQAGLPHFLDATLSISFNNHFASNEELRTLKITGDKWKHNVAISTSEEGFLMEQTATLTAVRVSDSEELPEELAKQIKTEEVILKDPDGKTRKEMYDFIYGEDERPIFSAKGKMNVDFSKSLVFPKLTIMENQITYGNQSIQQKTPKQFEPNEISPRTQFRKLVYEHQALQSQLSKKINLADPLFNQLSTDQRNSALEQIGPIRERMERIGQELDILEREHRNILLNTDFMSYKSISELESVNTNLELAANKKLLSDLQKNFGSISLSAGSELMDSKNASEISGPSQQIASMKITEEAVLQRILRIGQAEGFKELQELKQMEEAQEKFQNSLLQEKAQLERDEKRLPALLKNKEAEFITQNANLMQLRNDLESIPIAPENEEKRNRIVVTIKQLEISIPVLEGSYKDIQTKIEEIPTRLEELKNLIPQKQAEVVMAKKGQKQLLERFKRSETPEKPRTLSSTKAVMEAKQTKPGKGNRAEVTTKAETKRSPQPIQIAPAEQKESIRTTIEKPLEQKAGAPKSETKVTAAIKSKRQGEIALLKEQVDELFLPKDQKRLSYLKKQLPLISAKIEAKELNDKAIPFLGSKTPEAKAAFAAVKTAKMRVDALGGNSKERVSKQNLAELKSQRQSVQKEIAELSPKAPPKEKSIWEKLLDFFIPRKANISTRGKLAAQDSASVKGKPGLKIESPKTSETTPKAEAGQEKKFGPPKTQSGQSKEEAKEKNASVDLQKLFSETQDKTHDVSVAETTRPSVAEKKNTVSNASPQPISAENPALAKLRNKLHEAHRKYQGITWKKGATKEEQSEAKAAFIKAKGDYDKELQSHPEVVTGSSAKPDGKSHADLLKGLNNSKPAKKGTLDLGGQPQTQHVGAEKEQAREKQPLKTGLNKEAEPEKEPGIEPPTFSS